jgi:hypothetical protein
MTPRRQSPGPHTEKYEQFEYDGEIYYASDLQKAAKEIAKATRTGTIISI